MKSKKIVSVMLSLLMLISIMPTLVFAADSVTIQGPASLVSAPEGMYSSLSYVATFTPDSGTAITSATAPDSFTWSVTKSDNSSATDVSCVGGELIISGGAEGDFKITATYTGATPNVTSAEFPINIKKTKVYNWENENTLTNFTKQEETIFGATNHYGAIASNLAYTSQIPHSAIGKKTIRYKFRISPVEGQTLSTETFAVDTNFSEYIKCYPDTTLNKFGIEISSPSAQLRFLDDNTNKIKLDYGTWHELKLELDFKNNRFTLYVDSKPTVDGWGDEEAFYALPANFTSEGFHILRTSTKYSSAMDDFTEYSGGDFVPTVTNNTQKSILIPFNGKKVQTKCTATANVAGNITWKLPDEPAWAEIDKATGILTILDSAPVGSLDVRASMGDVYDDATLSLNKLEDSISEDTSWYAGEVKNENGNYYMDKASDLRYRVAAGMNGANDDFNLVIEQDIRPSASKASYNAQLFMAGTNFEWFSIQTAGIDGTDWVNLKIVINPKDGRFFILANDVPTDMWIKEGGKEVRVSEMTISTTDGTYPAIVKDIGYTNCQVDNLKIYNVSNNPARVYSAQIASGISTKGEINITNIVNINEDMNATANEYKWFTCQSDGSAEEEIEGETASSLDLSKLELGECYIKAKVRANHQSVLDNTIIYGTKWTDTNICQVADFVLGGPALLVNGVLSDTDNIVIDSDDTAVTLAISPIHTDGVEREILLVLAVYDKNSGEKELVNIAALNCRSEAEWTKDQSVTLTKLAKGSIVKAYVWDAKSLAPIKY